MPSDAPDALPPELAALKAAGLDPAQLADPRYRLDHLYTITTDEGRRVPFRMNDAQRLFLDRWWYLSIILKARQLGYTTLLGLIALDQALFIPNFTVGIIAHNLDDVGKIFRRKILEPYEALPEALRAAVPTVKRTESEIVLANGSSISVGMSMRSGTLQMLHVSEFGKIAAQYPEKAREIVTGAFEAVAPGQIIVVESTAEGNGGAFHDMVTKAQQVRDSGRPLTKLDFRLQFFPWYLRPSNTLSDAEASVIPISAEWRRYFEGVERQQRVTLTAGQKAWYVVKAERMGHDDMKRENPSCIAAFEPVYSTAGVTPIESVHVDGRRVLNRWSTGIKPVSRVVTSLGYELTCTTDHRIKTPTGFKPLAALAPGDEVLLGAAEESGCGTPQTVTYSTLPCLTCSVSITESFAELLGFFMGDGSFSSRTLSIVCTAADRDVVDRVKHLIRQHLAEPNERTIGGGTEVRLSNNRFEPLLFGLGVLRQNGGGQYMRRVCVPAYINRSPLLVVRAFLRGLFEADGFAQRNGTGVKFFTKYDDFARDVQLLLLRFGVTCKREKRQKIDGKGCVYTGWELTLRTSEAQRFGELIGFVGARKQARVDSLRKVAPQYLKMRLPVASQDRIESIAPAGEAEVYDITTASGEFVAGGIVVHNCEAEPFEVAVQGAILAKQMALVRRRHQIGRFPLIPGYPVNTFWDWGLNDDTVILAHQRINGVDRFSWSYANHGEGVEHYAQKLRQTGIEVWGTHYVPHDFDQRRPSLSSPITLADMCRQAGIKPLVVVPRVVSLRYGIQQMRQVLPLCAFDDEDAAELVTALDNYRYEWDDKLAVYRDTPRHDEYSHAASAFMQFALMHEQLRRLGPTPKAPEQQQRERRKESIFDKPRRRRSHMTV